MIMPLIAALLKQTMVADGLVFNKRLTINNHHGDSLNKHKYRLVR